MTITLGLILVPAMAEDAPSHPGSWGADEIVIEINGHVPGFSQAQLSQFLVRKLQEDTASHWHFSAANQVEHEFPNRLVWSFKTIDHVWKGGSHMGFSSPPRSETYLRSEVKLYLNNDYQMTLDMHPSMMSGGDRNELSEMASKVAHAMFVVFDTSRP